MFLLNVIIGLLVVEPIVKLLMVKLGTGLPLNTILENIVSYNDSLMQFYFWGMFPLLGFLLATGPLRKIPPILNIAFILFMVTFLLFQFDQSYQFPFYMNDILFMETFLLLTLGLGIYFQKEIDPPEDDRMRVLILDDDDVVKIYYRKVFENWGFQVDVASSSEDVIMAKNLYKYDLALIDLNLGDEKGQDAIKRLRAMQAFKATKTIAFSANEMAKISPGHFNGFHHKASPISELYQQVSMALN